MTIRADALLEAACEQAGSSDFGDPSFRDGLDVLVESLNAEAELSEVGALAAESMLTSALVSRLAATDWWNRHPDLANQTVEAPLFIVGIVRSGTTALHHLLSVDPRNRSLRQWESADPVPPPEAASYETDPRLAAAIEADENNMLHALNPDFKAMHYDPPNMPTECVTILAQDFVSLQYNATFNIETYARWILDRDHAPSYRYHKRFLQLLQSEHPGRWVCKTPHHALTVETIAEVYPDARFIWPHRDPATCIASASSITRSLTGTFSDAEWSEFEGRQWSMLLEEMVDRLTAARRTLGDDRFVDVDYRELVADPVATARKIYADLGEELSGEAEAAMERHGAEHRQNKHGSHTSTFEEFGLNKADLDTRFTTYRTTHNL